MSKLSPLKKGIWRSQELIRPVLGSSISIQPNVVAKPGRKNEIQKPNSKTLANRMLVRASNHETKIPSRQGDHLQHDADLDAVP